MRRCIKKGTVENAGLDLLNRVNPLMLVDDVGKPLVFTGISEMYLCLLCILCKRFPRGYIEPSFFVTEYYKANSYKARFEMRNGLKTGGSRPWVLYMNWTNLSNDNVQDLWKMFESLHRLFGTTGSYSDYLDGIRNFKKTYFELIEF